MRCSRFVLINKHHGGVASARNEGLKSVSGDYIGFMDSDDTIKPNMYSRVIEFQTEHSADICVCGAVNGTEINKQSSKGVVEKFHNDFIFDILENRIPSYLRKNCLMA